MPQVSATINGRRETFQVMPMEPLLDALRGLHLTGAKDGCREGECGACTVLVDDRPVNACLYPAEAVAGRRVDTVEGLRDDVAVGLRDSMVAAGAVQCGYCTPGMVVVLTCLLRLNRSPDERTVAPVVVWPNRAAASLAGR